LTAELSAVERQIGGAITSAAREQTVMDAFAGVPTAAQLRELDFAWEDGAAAVAALNRIITHDLPAAPAGGAAKPSAVPVPVRRR
ncbi:MAG TPA: hypothetical protein VME43_03725, partial [Bryobacteraceae bacterium]|nr:hypothetical protein [Bryobacteraceae bacterium]